MKGSPGTPPPPPSPPGAVGGPQIGLSPGDSGPTPKKKGSVSLVRTPSERVALRSNVTKEVARVALNRPEVAFSPAGQEPAAVEWLLHQDLGKIKEILDRDTGNPMTSPGPLYI